MDIKNAVAIVGLGLRFPGANNKQEFWDNLRNGKDCIETLSAQELIARGANPADVLKQSYVCRVSRLRNPEMFDANYFSMTNREAQMADPQLRVLLEVCQEAMDDSAHVLGGTNTGVFVGVADNDFWVSNLIYNNPDRIGGSLGNRVLVKKDYAAMQLSHKLNLTGPSFNLITACSSSAVALHEAITHLLMYECDFALAGGCEIDQGAGYLYEEGGIDSRDGYCRTFDAGASGTIFASGCGIVVVRRYEDAVADGDHIYAVILGSRINNDGRQKAGFTTPSVVGQSRVVQDALAAAEVDASNVSYVEAHGTGTLVGDPIEIEALTLAYRQFTDRKRFCGIGSVKTNMGHLSVAAGIAGVIKTALALKHKQLPASLHFDKPNSAIDFENSPFRVVTSLEEWKTEGLPRIAGVSSFGVGGTNSHMLLHEPPPQRASGETRPYQLVVLSAKSDEALVQMRANIANVLSDPMPDTRLADIAYSLQVGRAAMPLRCAVVCDSQTASSAVRKHSNWILGRDNANDSPILGCIFTDKAPVRAETVRGIYLHEVQFRSRIDACAEILFGLLELDIRSLLFPADGSRGEAEKLLRQPAHVDAIAFAVSYALSGLLQSWGVKGNSLVGEGIGEYVVACEAGVFSLADCLKLVAARTRVVAPLQASSEEMTGSKNEGATVEFRNAFSKVSIHAPIRGSIFNTCGREITYQNAADVNYWLDQMHKSAVDTGSIEVLGQLGCDLFVEVGAECLTTAILHDLRLRTIALFPSMEEGAEPYRGFLHSIGALWVAGVKVDWKAFSSAETRNRVDLPPYPFQHKRYWVEPSLPAEQKKLTGTPVHPLLGQRWSSSERVKAYENFVSASHSSYLADHRLGDRVIFPGAAYAEMALAAARLQFGSFPVRIQKIRFERALMLNDSATHHIQTVVYREQDDSFSFEIGCRATSDRLQLNSNDGWRLHSSGTFKRLVATDSSRRSDLSELMRRINIGNPLEFYASEVITYGPRFRGLVKLWTNGDEAIGRVELPLELRDAADAYRFHPVLMDSCFQAIGAITSRDPRLSPALPVGLVNCDIYSEIPLSFWVHIQCSRSGDEAVSERDVISDIAIEMFNDAGDTIARIENFERKALSADDAELEPAHSADTLCYEIAWVEQSNPVILSAADSLGMVILTDDREMANQIATDLSSDQRITVHDYLQNGDLEAAIRAAITESSRGSARVEVVMMRVSDRKIAIEDLCEALLRIVHAITDDSYDLRISLSILTKGCQSVLGSTVENLSSVSGAALWGMGTAIRREHPDLQCLRIDLDPYTRPDTAALLRELARSDNEDMVAHRGLIRYAARLIHLKKDEAPYPFQVRAADFGSFDALSRRDYRRQPVADDALEVEIFSAGLNFKETLITLGMLNTGHSSAVEVPLGFEGAGRITRIGSKIRDLAVGDDVIVWANGCLASHISVRRESVMKFDSQRIPFDQAASLPTVFMTAYFALHCLAKIRKGDKVLIHAAAGGVGQAALQIARAMGAEVFATASRGKWEYLARQGIAHVFDSRDANFSDDVLKVTAGHGVDVVLNSLTGDFIPNSFDALTQNGRFIEIGKLNIWTAERARSYRPDVAYHAFELGVGIAAGGAQAPLESWLRPSLEAIYQSDLDCPPVRVFPVDEVVSAFRWLAAGRNIGKAVIKVRDCKQRRSTSTISADKQYLVTGGLGALGLHVLRWLLENGARDITLLSRREPNGDIARELERLRAQGATISVASCDIANRGEVAAVLSGLPRLAGIFHCAGILDDGTLANLTRTRFEKVLRPKVGGVQVLHDLTLSLHLDIFVCFSSTSALLDGAGQGNYAAANAYLDSFAMYRRGLDLPALSINWGGWAGAGMAAELAERKSGVPHDLLDAKEALAALGRLIDSGQVSAVVTPMRGRLAGESGALPLYRELAPESLSAPAVFAPQMATEMEDSRGSITRLLKEEVGKVLGLKPQEVREEDDFIEAGIDSLMLAELRNNVQKAIGKKIPMAAFFGNSSVLALANHIVEERLASAARGVAPHQQTCSAEIIQLNPAAKGVKLFCIPGVGDNVFDFGHLSEAKPDFPICVLQTRVDVPPDAVETNEIVFLAKQYAAAIVGAQASGPYHLVGYSFGGSVAIEVANKLVANGHSVPTVTLMDSVPSFRYRNDPRFRHLAYMNFFHTLFESLAVSTAVMEEFYSHAVGMDTKEAVQYFRQILAETDALNRVGGIDFERLMTVFERRVNIPHQVEKGRLRNTGIMLIKASRPFHATALDAAFGFNRVDCAYGWEEMLDNKIDIVQLDCSHLGMLKPPYISNIANILTERCGAH